MNTISRRSFFAIVAIIASFFFVSTQSYAQASQLPAAVAAQVKQASEAGDGAALEAIAAAYPQLAAQIAQAGVDIAAGMVRSNPQGAAAIAVSAAKIVANPIVANAAPLIAAQVATTATQIVANPQVSAAAPTAPGLVQASAAAVANNPAVVSVAPRLAAQLAQTVSPAAPSIPDSVTEAQPIDNPSTVSQSGN